MSALSSGLWMCSFLSDWLFFAKIKRKSKELRHGSLKIIICQSRRTLASREVRLNNKCMSMVIRMELIDTDCK